MEMFYIPIIIFVLLVLLFVLTKVRAKKLAKPKEEKKEEPKVETKPEEKPKQIIIPQEIDLVSRPDFSDMVKIDEPKKQPSKPKQKVIMVSENILNSGNEYRRDEMPRNTDLSNEIADLSPELKAIIFGNILNDR